MTSVSTSSGRGGWSSCGRGLVTEFAGAFDATIYPEGYLEDLRSEWP